MWLENTNYATDYEAYVITPSSTSDTLTFDNPVWHFRIQNDGPDDVLIAVNKDLGGSNTDISIKASEVFDGQLVASSISYVLAPSSTSASLRVTGFK